MDNIMVDVMNNMIDLEKQFDQSSFLQVPELEEPMNIPPIIQALVNEEKNPKINREEASISAMETIDEQFKLNKRPKLNLVSEQEENIASEDIIDTKAMGQRSKWTTETKTAIYIQHTDHTETKECGGVFLCQASRQGNRYHGRIQGD